MHERARAFACLLLTYLRRVLRTIITRISLRNSPAIESAGNIIRSPDLARVGARERRTARRTEKDRSGAVFVSLYPLVLMRVRRVRSAGRILLRNSPAISLSLSL